MIQLGPCEITGAFGPMASGKTYLIDRWLENNNHFVRFDVTGESCDDPNIEHVWASPSLLWQRLKTNPYYFRIAYHPGPNLEEDFEYAVRCLWRIKTFKTLVCDEFHEVCSVHETPPFVRTVLRYARHNHMSVIGASQRLADVHKLFTAGCRQVVLFWTQEARDLDAISQRWGMDTAETVRNLRPLIYDDVRKKTLQIPQAVVCSKATLPRVFDFSTDSYVGLSKSAEANADTEDSSVGSASNNQETDTEIRSDNSIGAPEPEPLSKDSGNVNG
jgi:hypothetical protein